MAKVTEMPKQATLLGDPIDYDRAKENERAPLTVEGSDTEEVEDIVNTDPYWIWSRFQTIHVDHIGDRDIKGCAFLDIQGENGAGKSLTELCFMACFDKTLCSPKLIAAGFDEAEIRLSLVLSDNSMTLTIRRVIKHKGDADVEIKYGDGSIVKKQVETFLKGLASGFGLNPLLLLPDDAVNRKKREEFFRDNLPVDFDGEVVGQILGQPGLPKKFGLDKFEEYLAGAEERRTILGRERDQIDGAIAIIAPSIPTTVEVETNWGVEVDRLQKALTEKEKALLAQEQSINNEAQGKKNDRGKKLRADIEEATRQLTAAAEIDYEIYRNEAEQKVSDARAARHDEIAAINEDLGGAKAKQESQAETRGRIKHYEEQRKKQEGIALRAATAQRIVEKLVEHRAGKFAMLPSGMSYRKGGFISIVDKKTGKVLDFDTEINKARRVKLAMQIASFAKNPVHVFVVDEAESLDEGSMRWTQDAANDIAYQVIYATRMPKGSPLRFVRMNSKGEVLADGE